MSRTYWYTIYVDRDPNDPYKGWGWIEVTTEDSKRFGIPTGYPDTYTKFCKFPSERFKLPNSGNLPSIGKAGAKRFTLNLDGELVTIRAQKSLTIQAICAWCKTWACPNAKLITPGNRTHSIDGDKLAHQAHFIYFILNEDSNAIKIGRAKDLTKRMNALQTSSPAKLRLIKSVQVEGRKEAHELEKSLHKQFNEIRLAGEWFKAEPSLLGYINQL
ncbi:MAG: GIY-YIG nuclease family protein [Coleofasciculus sp. C1-SOL-03]|jgi:predicted GIY-YIG superfamily endonuclease|uniref:GIY-YIG nuclease family protein n=1 Tax=Coleofasciculus sp. C1-SOL-03 TaxID=3069522 RepID=UPI0033008BC7